LLGNLARLGGLQCPETVGIRPNPRSNVAENSTPFDRLAIPPSRERRGGRAYGLINVYRIPDGDLADGKSISRAGGPQIFAGVRWHICAIDPMTVAG
jgi:hypothetical protein